MEQIKAMTTANSYDSQYRKKALTYYSKKISKQFKLKEQPEYLRERRFNSDFKAFMKSIPEFEAMRESGGKDRNSNRSRLSFICLNMQTLL